MGFIESSLTRYIIIHQCRNVILQHLYVFSNDMSCRTVLLITQQLVVSLRDVSEFVSQIVLKRSLDCHTFRLARLHRYLFVTSYGVAWGHRK